MKKNKTRYVTSRAMRLMDRHAIKRLGIPALVLMENAGRAVALKALSWAPRRAVIFCGRGNNGGDGLVAARHLLNHGVRCVVVVFSPITRMTYEARINLNILKKMHVPILPWKKILKPASLFKKKDVIVDALFGLGLKRAMEPPYSDAIELINRSKVRVLSVDIPSGLDADRGTALGICVKADCTVTLAYPKKGFLNQASRRYTGPVFVADISIPKK